MKPKPLSTNAPFATRLTGIVAVAYALLLTPCGFGQRNENGTEKGGAITGELKQWHKITLTLDGPSARETDSDPNPFTDYRMTVTFRHESGSPEYKVPGYFAADGNAANTSASQGNKWRAHLSPDKAGQWNYEVSFVRGKYAAFDDSARGERIESADGLRGAFKVERSDKTGRDFRGRGRLQYVGERYLKFAQSDEFFLKAGPDSPENLLAYADFDGTQVGIKGPRQPRAGEAVPSGLHRYEPHVRDWRNGDPTWQDSKGNGLIGALNYLAGKGCNAFSFLTYNKGGDGNDVWPFVAPDDKLHYDCSKLDQWQIVFDHAQQLGLYLHFKLQETEIDDNRAGQSGKGRVPSSLDGGDLGIERKLYCRELVARFAHELALNWNLGEENTQSTEQQYAMAGYIRELDPYDHLIVVHTYPNQQDQVYTPLLGKTSAITGTSLQNGWDQVHQRTLKWIDESERAGRPWVVANDEQGPADMGVPPDPGYRGSDGKARQGKRAYDLHDIRKSTLWGNLMAGGAGVEYYFGYTLPQNDLRCEDFRSRDRSWDYCAIALGFFKEHKIPFWEMQNADELVGNERHGNSKYCFAKPGELYLVYLPDGGEANLDLRAAEGRYVVKWFDPRNGGRLQDGSVKEIMGGNNVALGRPPQDEKEDWLIVIRRP
ncbi:MAG: DUF5060 domain-containing protein [Pirellulales bacterium]